MKKFSAVIALVIGILLGACGITSVSAIQENPIKIWPENENGPYKVMKVIDDDTGVNYIAVVAHQYDNGGWGLAVTPRLNADGTLYVSGD